MLFWRVPLAAAGVLILLVPNAGVGQTARNFLKDAGQALRAGKPDDALALANKAVAQDPKDTSCLGLRAMIFSRLDLHEKALADWTKLIELAPDEAEHYNARGAVQFQLGRFSDS